MRLWLRSFAIIDASNGQVFFPPEVRHVIMTHVAEPVDPLQRQLERPRFRRDSALFIVVGAVNEGKDEGIFYYLWAKEELKPIDVFRSEKFMCAANMGRK